MDFEQTALWRNGFTSNAAQDHNAVSLRTALLKMRDQVAFLVGEIPLDLKNFTVHDITHLDALWSIASEIAGEGYSLNPIEAFVFGGAVLLHDAGMSSAAYPRRSDCYKTTASWRSAARKYAVNTDNLSAGEQAQVILQVLRDEHATRALELITSEWRTPDNRKRMLLEDSSLRQKFGLFIGQIAASHWWGHDKLRLSLDRIVPAPPPFPTAWRLDLLKLASLLRVADAAHLDERRAPGFLWALRQRSLDEEANKHWLFQNRLTQPERRIDAIHYSSTSHFSKSESEAWWLAYETLQVVNTELRKTDIMLADLRTPDCRFAARRVAEVDSPETLTRSVTVSGWTPVDTKLHISDVKGLVETLGGNALYGNNPDVVIRELVQNGLDAIAMRIALDRAFKYEDALIKIQVSKDGDGDYLIVTDNGVGMDEETLTGPLLDFGSSGWKEQPVSKDYPQTNLGKVKTIGKFGIGFFASFMVGDKVELVTRRFDKSLSDSLSLRFESGLRARPVLSPADKVDWLYGGGTTIKIKLNKDIIKRRHSQRKPWVICVNCFLQSLLKSWRLTKERKQLSTLQVGRPNLVKHY